jgi:cytochrome c peroxidase
MQLTRAVARHAISTASWLTWLYAATAGLACHHPRPSPPGTPATAEAPDTLRGDQPIQPIAAPPWRDRGKVDLGRRLFADRRLSRDDSISCLSCHDLATGGADGRPVAVGVGGAIGPVNTPTVFNADLNIKQFWDGRADTLEDQIDGPIQNPKEMDTTWTAVVAKLERDPRYRADLGHLYASGVTVANIKDAIATYERTLVTQNARFDRYLAGDPAALSRDEVDGYAAFKSYGCVSCHEGRNVGGNLFQSLGILGDYFADRGGPVSQSDLGRFNVTRRPEDRFKFRVPSLRLVTLTAPYFHDGRVATLQQAIRLMARYQLGKQIPPADIDHIAAFLGALAGGYVPEESFAAR